MPKVTNIHICEFKSEFEKNPCTNLGPYEDEEYIQEKKSHVRITLEGLFND